MIPNGGSKTGDGDKKLKKETRAIIGKLYLSTKVITPLATVASLRAKTLVLCRSHVKR